MSATFTWSESNGAGQVVTDGIINLNFGSKDSPNLNTTSHPICQGEASFEKYIRAKFTGIGTSISNMMFWKNTGTYVTGEKITFYNNIASYATPTKTPNADWDIEGQWGFPQAEDGTYTITPGSVSPYTKYQRLQLQTTGSTPSGAVNTKTFMFQYDEV